MDELRRTTFGAVAMSFTLACLLLLFVINVAKQPAKEADSFVSALGILVLTGLTIYPWIRCARKYIDQAIDRKLTTRER